MSNAFQLIGKILNDEINKMTSGLMRLYIKHDVIICTDMKFTQQYCQ